VKAAREGWQDYLRDPQPANQKMNQLNPSIAADVFAEVAEAQKPLIGADTLGSMTKDRWATLIAQLKDLGDIQTSLSPEECFRAL